MKRLYLVGGPMGVGKTAACRRLEQMLPACAFLDGDWCWDMHPFQVTEETKALVLDNICHVLNNFLACSAFENVVFCWVMHQQAIWDALAAHLHTQGWQVVRAALVCAPETLRARVEGDASRAPDAAARSLAYLPLYGALDVAQIDVTGLAPEGAARALLALKGEDP